MSGACRIIRSLLLNASYLGLLAIFGFLGPVRAQESKLQLFGGVEKAVVAVGEPLEFHVEVYASAGSMLESKRLREAVELATLEPVPAGLEILRSETTTGWLPAAELDRPLCRITRRFVLRTVNTGSVLIPAFRLRLDGHTYATRPQEVYSYTVESGFFAAGRMILPVVVRHRNGNRHYARIGSAFLAAPDAVVTSYHVILDAEEVRLVLPGGQRIATRKAWAVDPQRDVAILHVDSGLIRQAGLAPLKLVPTGAVRDPAAPHPEQDVAFTYGWPGGVQHSSVGVIYQGLELQSDRRIWVTTNPVRPGDSGGPLLDASGRVLGVVTAGSIATDEPDVLREEVTVAADPRPALAQMMVAGAPRSLKSFWRNPDVVEQPHARALRTSLLLTTRPVGPALATQAVQELDAAVEKAPGDAGLLFMRGSINDMLGRHKAAAAAYRQALDLSSDYFPAALMLGLHHLHQDQYAEAERLFQRVQAIGAYRHLATYGLAQAYVHAHAYDRAVDQLQQVLHYDLAFAPAYFHLAYAYIALGEVELARQLHARLQELDPFWAGRLRQVLRNDAFRPRQLQELPRAPIRLLNPPPS